MSFRERLFIDRLVPDAKKTLGRMLLKRRDQVLGNTPVVFRVRKYKHAGEIRDERVSVVKPQIHDVRLWSGTLRKFVNIKTTPQMLRYIEACGGLDDYLKNTPDSQLKSDIASSLKWRISQAQAAAARGGITGSSSSSSILASSTRGKAGAGHSAAVKSNATGSAVSDSHSHSSSSSSSSSAGLPGGRPLSPGAAAVLHAKQELEHARTASAVRTLLTTHTHQRSQPCQFDGAGGGGLRWH